MNKLQLVKSAAKDFSMLSEPYKSQIKEHLNELENQGLNLQNIKPLTGKLKGYFRLRSGDYRIVFSIESNYITVVSILNRKDVYKKK